MGMNKIKIKSSFILHGNYLIYELCPHLKLII
jgi:hypothetical protein